MFGGYGLITPVFADTPASVQSGVQSDAQSGVQSGVQSDVQMMSFSDWKRDFAGKALAAGIAEPLITEFVQKTQPYERAITHDNNQSEFKKFLWDYLSSAVSAQRVITGKAQYQQYTGLFDEISQQTGVPGHIVTAIWGMESNYGGFMGNVPIISAMATLAYDGRRRAFFEQELLAALKLISRGDLSSLDITGSWAGGMGHTQFIPSTYLQYAIDFNQDGRRDLWEANDALASAGFYLAEMGWQSGYTWGREVSLSTDFDYWLANNRSDWLSLSQWQSHGVRAVDGAPLPAVDIEAQLFVPAGRFGPKFLLYRNFDVIKRYNNSDAYALAVGLLSDQIAGRAPLSVAWPNNAKPVSSNDIKLIQQSLNSKGFDAGAVDGLFGNKTRRALQQFQQSKGMVADGFLTTELYRDVVSP